MNQRSQRSTLRFAAAALGLCLACLAPPPFASAQTKFDGLGFVPGEPSMSYSGGLSADGSVVLGFSDSWSGSDRPFVWSQGVMTVPNRPTGWSFDSTQLSRDGLTIAGTAGIPGEPGPRVYRWRKATGYEVLDTPPGMSAAWNASPSIDASILAVTATNGKAGEPTAFLWREGSGYTLLADPVTDPYSRGTSVTHISADGGAAAGGGFNGGGTSRTFYWTGTTGMIDVGGLDGEQFSRAAGISGDGSTVVGNSSAAANGSSRGFRWSLANGMQALSLPAGSTTCEAMGISGDGSIVVGITPTYGATLWNDSGAVDLQHYLEQVVGLDLTGWDLLAASAISSDGLTIAGWGTNPAGQTEAWVAVIPAPAAWIFAAGAASVACHRRRS